MGSLADLQKQLRQKDEKIKDLQKQILIRDSQLAELRSQLDKFHSIMVAPNSKSTGSRRKVRAQGISAEPQAQRSLKEISNTSFKKHKKTTR